MTERENDSEQLSINEFGEVLYEIFYDIAEQHGLGSAVAAFLATLGMTAVETDTIGYLAASMSKTLNIAAQESTDPNTVN